MSAVINTYDTDVVAWANEQAQLLRAGRFDALDIEHIADEIEDVGKSEKREFRSRMAVLLAHLLKWQYQPDRRGNSWRRTIKIQRREVAGCLEDMPSLKADLGRPAWRENTWADTLTLATKETGLSFEAFPEECPWTMAQVFDTEFWPEQTS